MCFNGLAHGALPECHPKCREAVAVAVVRKMGCAGKAKCILVLETVI